MNTTAQGKDGKAVSTKELMTKEPDGTLEIPFRDISGSEGMAMGFRQSMLEVGPGEVLTGAGLGTDFIILKWEDKEIAVRGSELLKTWVATFDPENAARIPALPT